MAEVEAVNGLHPDVAEKLRQQEMQEQVAAQAAPAPPDHKEQLMGRRADYINRIANIDHLIELIT